MIWRDARLVGPALGVWGGALSALLAASISVPWFIAFAGGVVGLIWRRPLVLLSALGIVVGVLSAGLTIMGTHVEPVATWAQQRAYVTAIGVVTTDPQLQASQFASSGIRRNFVVTVESMQSMRQAMVVNVPILVSCECNPEVGTRLEFSGRLSPQHRYGDWVTILRTDADPILIADPNLINDTANRLRSGLREALTGIDPRSAALIAGLAVGDESLQDEQLADDMQLSGLSHLTAVSGGNVSIVVITVLGIVAGLGLGRRTRYVVVALAVVGFVVLVRPQPSVLRAAVMGSIGVIGMFSGRPGRGLPALCVAVIALVVLSPGLAISYAFALSVVATAGLLVVAPPLLGWIRQHRWLGYLPVPVVAALAVTVAAQFVTAPILLLMGSDVGLAGVPANLLAAPAVAPVTVLGLLTSIVSLFSVAVAHAIAFIAAVPARWIAYLAEQGATWPTLPLPATGWSAAIVVLSVAAWLRWRRRRTMVATIATAVLILATVRPGSFREWPPAGWVMIVCDVGQGDAIVVASGPESATVIDAGPEPRDVDRCLGDAGIDDVSLMVLTHFNADHVGGIGGINRGRSVGRILTTSLAVPETQAETVFAWARNGDIPIRSTGIGEVISDGLATWRVLGPRPGVVDENAASVVLLGEVQGVRLLLTGDIEPTAQNQLVAAEAPVNVDVVKVPHHGSRFRDDRFSSWTGARLAVISVGADNGYGHPAEETISDWQAEGAIVVRTDQVGDVAIVRGENGELGWVGSRS